MYHVAIGIEKGGDMQYDLKVIKNYDLVDYLANLGFEPKSIRGINYWYFSPFRKEKTAFFKVNRKINRWYDHGIAKGGTLIDFGIHYFQCDFKEFLERWAASNFSTIDQIKPYQKVTLIEESKLVIKCVKALTSPALLNYLNEREVDPKIGKQYCKQVTYKLGDKSYYGPGFQNDSGGFELRNPFYKYASSPKDITSIIQNHLEVNVFEGFMDFLSYLTYQPKSIKENDFIILNGLGFFEKAKFLLKHHQHIHLYLDRDPSGIKAIASALASDKRYKDESMHYQHHKDFNEWWIKKNNSHPKHDNKLRLKLSSNNRILTSLYPAR